MNKEELQRRTQLFAIAVIKFVELLPSNSTTNTLTKQLIRCATSIGANYRSACKGKSKADFINKIIIVEEEADEAIYWLELIENTVKTSLPEIIILKKEANELTAIFTAIGKTAKQNQLIKKST